MYSTIIVPSLLFLSVNGAAALSFKREVPFAGAKRDAASDFLNTLMQEMGVPSNGTTNGTASAAYVPVAAAVPAAAGQPGQFNTVAGGTSTPGSNLTGTVSDMENDVSDLSAQLNALLAELSSTSTQTAAAGVPPVAGQPNSPAPAPPVAAQSNSSLPASPADAQPDNLVPAPPAGAQTDDSAPPAGAQTDDSSSDPTVGLQSNGSDPSAPAGAPSDGSVPATPAGAPSVGAPADAASLAGACGAPPAGAPGVNAPPSAPTPVSMSSSSMSSSSMSSSSTSSASTSPTPGAQRRGSPTYGRRRLDRGLYARQASPSPTPSGLANQVFGEADTLGDDVLAGLNALVGDLPATLQPTASAVVSQVAAAVGGAFNTLEQDLARRSTQSNAGHSAVFSASNMGLMTAFASMAFGAFLVL